MPALEKAAFEVHPGFAVLDFPCALVANGVTRRAGAGEVDRVELELTGWNDVFPTGFGQVLAAIFNPVVQMTAFKRPVYCAQLPAICQG